MVVKVVPKVCNDKTRGKGTCHLVHEVVQSRK